MRFLFIIFFLNLKVVIAAFGLDDRQKQCIKTQLGEQRHMLEALCTHRDVSDIFSVTDHAFTEALRRLRGIVVTACGVPGKDGAIRAIVQEVAFRHFRDEFCSTAGSGGAAPPPDAVAVPGGRSTDILERLPVARERVSGTKRIDEINFGLGGSPTIVRTNGYNISLDVDQDAHQPTTSKIFPVVGRHSKGGKSQFPATANLAWHQAHTYPYVATIIGQIMTAGLLPNGTWFNFTQSKPVYVEAARMNISFEGYIYRDATGAIFARFHCYPARR